jgi:dephospho-CoA kinase
MMLGQLGAAVVDADAISRQLTAPSGAAIPEIAQQLGPHCIASDGGLDRAGVRDLVFRNPDAKLQLERIIHPLVAQEVKQQVASAQRSAVPCIVLDIPLLVESANWRARVDRVLVVDCIEATQIARVMQRSGLALAEIERILRIQASRHQRLKAADLVLYNEGLTMDELGREVRQIGAKFGL